VLRVLYADQRVAVGHESTAKLHCPRGMSTS
jgi:hypothetical protein